MAGEFHEIHIDSGIILFVWYVMAIFVMVARLHRFSSTLHLIPVSYS